MEKALRDTEKRDPDHLDRWLISVMRHRVETATSSLETMKIRKALSVALLDVWNDIRWYLRREESPRRQTLELVSETWIRLLSPFIPFAAEELNQRMGGKGMITTADWPSTIEFPEDPAAETAELLVNRVLEDARNLLKIIKESQEHPEPLRLLGRGPGLLPGAVQGPEGARGSRRGDQEVREDGDKAREGHQAPVRARRGARRAGSPA